MFPERKWCRKRLIWSRINHSSPLPSDTHTLSVSISAIPLPKGMGWNSVCLDRYDNTDSLQTCNRASLFWGFPRTLGYANIPPEAGMTCTDSPCCFYDSSYSLRKGTVNPWFIFLSFYGRDITPSAPTRCQQQDRQWWSMNCNVHRQSSCPGYISNHSLSQEQDAQLIDR